MTSEVNTLSVVDTVEKVSPVLSSLAADSISVWQAGPRRPAFTFHRPLSLSRTLISEANTLPTATSVQTRPGGDGEQTVMIHTVQGKLAPLITSLITQLNLSHNAFPLCLCRASYKPNSLETGPGPWATINDMFWPWRSRGTVFVEMSLFTCSIFTRALCFSLFRRTVDTCLIIN